MKWMGWSWSDLEDAPQEHIQVITELIIEENEKAERDAN